MILSYVGDVLQEQHSEDEIFVGVSTDGATEGITDSPERPVNTILVDLVVHFTASFLLIHSRH